MLEAKSFDAPEETRKFADRGWADFVTLGGTSVFRGTYEPGWRWSEHIKPIAGTDSCQSTHTGYVLKGRMHVVADDGAEAEVGPGEAFHIPPGHDAWVVGDEACVLIDFTGGGGYAK